MDAERYLEHLEQWYFSERVKYYLDKALKKFGERKWEELLSKSDLLMDDEMDPFFLERKVFGAPCFTSRYDT